MGCGPSKDATKAVSTAPAAVPVLTTAELKKAEEKAEVERQRAERIGVSAEPLPDFTPNASFVIKTKRTNTHQKVFINVYHHELVPVESRFVTRNEQWKVDRKGENVCVFTCVLPAATYVSILKDPTLQPPMCLKIINLLNDLYPMAMLDTEYVLPKIHAGYIGARIDLISSDPNAPKYAPSPTVTVKKTIEPEPVKEVAAPAFVAKAAPVTAPALVNPHLTLQKSQAEEKAQFVLAPPKMQGWLKKKGHIVINWKTRYFVLDSGYLTYYVDELDEPPYGRDRKGQLCLAGYRTVHSGTQGANTMGADTGAPEFQCRIQLLLMDPSFQERSGRLADCHEFTIETPSQEDKHAWLAALSAHIHYVESSFKLSTHVEQQVNETGKTPTGAVAADNSVASGVMVSAANSVGNLGSRASPVTTTDSAAMVSTLTATHDPKQWMVYCKHGEHVILCGEVNKPNPLGKTLIRELILTSKKRLVYVDSKSLEQKGEIDWAVAKVEPFVKWINATTFEIHSSDENKVYKFITHDELTAQHWVDAINSVKKDQ